jgi:MFS superfamily sulfate permease-like transporter
MNGVDIGAWKANWAWSLPLIVLSVVIHVIGLGLINESVVRVLSGAMERRRFMPKFAAVIGLAALLATVLHGIEAATWATAYRPRPSPPSCARR